MIIEARRLQVQERVASQKRRCFMVNLLRIWVAFGLLAGLG